MREYPGYPKIVVIAYPKTGLRYFIVFIDTLYYYRGDGYNSGLYNSGKGIKTEIIPDYDFADDNSGLKI